MANRYSKMDWPWTVGARDGPPTGNGSIMGTSRIVFLRIELMKNDIATSMADRYSKMDWPWTVGARDGPPTGNGSITGTRRRLRRGTHLMQWNAAGPFDRRDHT